MSFSYLFNIRVKTKKATSVIEVAFEMQKTALKIYCCAPNTGANFFI
ncbi:hypothetical protein SAMN05216464_101240 [Mucilaginibacter pineti]|uniref:Transposase n=1 Tax=Mucilaginibacter pineti TaxID=1391627 RepID=A0A1G6TAY1_9SPHI|nr:hypothetical protein SAMN05216464_101240 [Mucilaginibacter pineti]